MGVQKIKIFDFCQRAGSGREWCYMVLEVPGAAFRGLKRAFSVSTGVFSCSEGSLRRVRLVVAWVAREGIGPKNLEFLYFCESRPNDMK